MKSQSKPTRHILSLSGGKDSAALAIYMRDRVPEMEYIFSDTRKELPETYEYLEAIGAYLGKKVNRLNADLGFDHWYDVYGGMIPSNHRRWCTNTGRSAAEICASGGFAKQRKLGSRFRAICSSRIHAGDKVCCAFQ